MDEPRFATRRLLSDCVHCGLCLEACPTYRELGVEPDSPRGRIWLMKGLAEGRLEPDRALVTHLDQCLGCRACETACPSGVQYGRLLEAARGWLEEGNRSKRPAGDAWFRRLFIGHVMTHAGRFRAASAALLLAGIPGFGRLVGALLPAGVDPRSLARASRREPRAEFDRLGGARALAGRDGRRIATIVPGAPPLRGRLLFPTGCVMDALFGGVNAATARVLAREGWDVIIPAASTCCGALAAHAGLADRARRLARDAAAVLRVAGQAAAFRATEQAAATADTGRPIDFVVTNSAGCGAMMKEWEHWVGGVGDLSGRVRDVSEILAMHPLRGTGAEGGPTTGGGSSAGRPVRVAWHDACHLAHGQGVRREPRQLLAQIPGIELVPLADSDACCGSAGTYNLLEPEMAARLGERKVSRIRESGADVIATGNMGCVVQIRMAMEGDPGTPPIPIRHLVELLDRGAGPGL
jgi:glycolate oxidase iron-sulfur subunit